MKSTALAHPNIALVKYWGKREASLNLPAKGSLSLTLGPIGTTTTVEWLDAPGDSVMLNERAADAKTTAKVSEFLDLIRALRPGLGGARVVTANDFPTAAGLASSSSAFAALAVAATSAAGLSPTPTELSILARRGSGSAARSIFGGFAEMCTNPDDPSGAGDAARAIFPENHWELRVLVAVTTEKSKDVPSGAGMNLTAKTSPYYSAWLSTVDACIADAKLAIAARDFEKLGEISEFSALAMHASAFAARPGVIYWNGATLDIIRSIRALRERGFPVFFTVDAGPHVKVFTTAADHDRVVSALSAMDGVVRVISTQPAAGARVIA